MAGVSAIHAFQMRINNTRKRRHRPAPEMKTDQAFITTAEPKRGRRADADRR